MVRTLVPCIPVLLVIELNKSKCILCMALIRKFMLNVRIIGKLHKMRDDEQILWNCILMKAFILIIKILELEENSDII